MKRFKILYIIICVLLYNGVDAQTKNEKESRVDIDLFPKHAISIIKTLPEDIKRVRYYKEIDGTKHSFEVKFKYKKHWYSVEFDTSGIIEDIEITIKKRQISDDASKAINTYFTEHSNKFDLIKIQEQYLYNTHISEDKFLNSIIENRETMAMNYEVIVAIKSDKIWELKEITFDNKGHLLSVRILQQDSYEYIMY